MRRSAKMKFQHVRKTCGSFKIPQVPLFTAVPQDYRLHAKVSVRF